MLPANAAAKAGPSGCKTRRKQDQVSIFSLTLLVSVGLSLITFSVAMSSVLTNFNVVD